MSDVYGGSFRYATPICPRCGKPALLVDDRFNGKYSHCGLWSWGGKPLASKQEHARRKAEYKAKGPGFVSEIMMDGDDELVPDLAASEWHAVLGVPIGASEWHAVLGVPIGASEQEILRAYRKLMKVHHPDAGGSDDAMARINVARDTGLAIRREACTRSLD